MVEYFEVDNHWVDKGTDIHDESVENCVGEGVDVPGENIVNGEMVMLVRILMCRQRTLWLVFLYQITF